MWKLNFLSNPLTRMSYYYFSKVSHFDYFGIHFVYCSYLLLNIPFIVTTYSLEKQVQLYICTLWCKKQIIKKFHDWEKISKCQTNHPAVMVVVYKSNTLVERPRWIKCIRFIGLDQWRNDIKTECIFFVTIHGC